MRCFIISSEKNEAPHYFFRKKWSTLLFLQKKWSSPLFLQKNKSAFVSKELVRSLIFFKRTHEAFLFFLKKWSGTQSCEFNNPTNAISAMKRSGTSLFLEKKRSASLSLQKKMKFLIISWEQMLFFSEEIMRCLIFCWRNAGVPNLFCSKIRKCLFFVWRNDQALGLATSRVPLTLFLP